MKTIWFNENHLFGFRQSHFSFCEMKFVLYLAFLGLVSSDKILDFVSKNHIMQARCRLQHCEPGTAASSKCWQDCSRSFLSQKAKGHIIKEQKSPINISLAFKGCNIVEWHRLFPYSKAIYQVYTQDHQNAWHDEGERINLLFIIPKLYLILLYLRENSKPVQFIYIEGQKVKMIFRAKVRNKIVKLPFWEFMRENSKW